MGKEFEKEGQTKLKVRRSKEIRKISNNQSNPTPKATREGRTNKIQSQ